MSKAVNRKPLDPKPDNQDTHTSPDTPAKPSTPDSIDTHQDSDSATGKPTSPTKHDDTKSASKKPSKTNSTPPLEVDGYIVGKLQDDYVSGLICAMLCKGYLSAEIRDILINKHKIWIHRKAVDAHFKKEVRRRRFSYHPPLHEALRTEVMESFPGLLGVEVVDTDDTEAVSKRGAGMLGRLIKQTRALKLASHGDASMHLGLSGGPTLRYLSKHFSDYLVDSYGDLDGRLPKDFPSELHLHALVAGFDLRDPTLEPNAMFTNLHLANRVPIKMKFVGLHAPPAVTPETYNLMMQVPGIKTSIREAEKVDIVVTGMGDWKDPNCMLRKCMSQSPKAMDQLEAAGVCGDIMLQPISEKGPILETTAIQALTALKLPDLSQLIRRNGKVMLAVGPRQSGKTKANVLRQILNFKTPLVSHLVLDSKTAKELVV